MKTEPAPAMFAVNSDQTAMSARQLERARGDVRLTIDATGLKENFQAGATKVRFLRPRETGAVEAVLINTAGGLTGGDQVTVSVTAAAGAVAVVTTQAAERIYRRSSGLAEIDTTLAVAAGGSLDWLPQETIVFDRSGLRRTLTADIDREGRLLAVEAIILGRAAMGETAKDIVLSDSWRIRRGGRLIFADGLRLEGDATRIMAGGATGAGATALATLVLVAPQAECTLDSAREMLATCSATAGASAWNGMLVARLLSPAGQPLRADLIRLIEGLRGAPMPRDWTC